MILSDKDDEEIDEMVVMPPLVSTVVSVTSGKAADLPEGFDVENEPEQETSTRYFNQFRSPHPAPFGLSI